MLAEVGDEAVVEMYVRLRDAGWPDPKSLEVLTEVERSKMRRLQQINLQINTNAKYQYELGLLDDVTFSSSAKVLEQMSPVWVALGFEDLVDTLK